VQDLLLRHAGTVRAWVADGAAIYVCGSLEGMAAGVDHALREILTGEEMGDMSSSGRYRRDVY